MKKLFTILLIAFTSFARAQTTQTRVIDAVTKDTVLITNTATTVSTTTVASTAKVYRYNPPVVIPPPVVTVPAYNKTFRYSVANYAYYLKGLPVGPINSIPAAKGGIPMAYTGISNPTLSLTYPSITKEGMLFVQNEGGVKYTALIKGSPSINNPTDATYPRETWFVIYKPNYFMFEKFMEDDFYMGDMGGANNGIRFTNDNTAGFEFINSIIPINQYSVYRVRLTAIPNNSNYVNVELWINGVKQTNNQQVQAWYRQYTMIGIGTDTNNEYVLWAELFTTPGALTDAQATQVFTEINTEYSIGKPIQAPYADNIILTYDQKGNKTVSYTYINPLGIAEDKSKLQIRWIQWPDGGPGSAVYNHAYDNQLTVPSSFGAGTVQVTVTDMQGNVRGFPENKYFSN